MERRFDEGARRGGGPLRVRFAARPAEELPPASRLGELFRDLGSWDDSEA